MGASQSSISPATKTPGFRRSMKRTSSSAKGTPPAVDMARAIGAVAVSRTGTLFIMAASSAGVPVARGFPVRARGLVQEPHRDRSQLGGLPQDVGKRLLFPGPRKRGFQILHRQSGPKVYCKCNFLVAFDGVAQFRRERINRAAFKADPGHDRFAAYLLAAETEFGPFQRLAVEALAEEIGKVSYETAIGRLQGRYGDARVLENVLSNDHRTQAGASLRRQGRELRHRLTPRCVHPVF